MISLESFESMPKAQPVEGVASAIRVIRGMRVMLDADLAEFYGVETKALNQAVRRNIHRFPGDFAFVLEAEDIAVLRSQIVTSSSGSVHGGRRYRPWAFTEHGAVMLASVLNSATAITASVAIVRAFVQMREALQISGGDLVAKLTQIDGRLDGHDATLEQVVAALNALLSPATKAGKEMGFHTLREDEAAGSPRNGKLKTVRYTSTRKARTGRRKESLS